MILLNFFLEMDRTEISVLIDQNVKPSEGLDFVSGELGLSKPFSPGLSGVFFCRSKISIILYMLSTLNEPLAQMIDDQTLC